MVLGSIVGSNYYNISPRNVYREQTGIDCVSGEESVMRETRCVRHYTTVLQQSSQYRTKKTVILLRICYPVSVRYEPFRITAANHV